MSVESPNFALAGELTGAAAPPRRNGELVFAAPWHSRAFGMVVGLHRRGVFEWEEFRQRLIARIGAWDASHAPGGDYDYYAHWLGALQDVLIARGFVGAADIEALTREIARRPGDAGHRHDHHPHPHPDD
ncbi:MAG: nitrile hydratase accessory protein [Gammaproteobacteria bacterium]|nr:nitrile hydratase accessory protein [Gammaproteobacteria bacterium]